MVSYRCKKTQPPEHLVLAARGFGVRAQLEGSPSCLWADFGVSCRGKLCSLSPGREHDEQGWGWLLPAAGCGVSLLGSSRAGLPGANGSATGWGLRGWQGVTLGLGLRSAYRVRSGLVLNTGKW